VLGMDAEDETAPDAEMLVDKPDAMCDELESMLIRNDSER
jgi:hypothetical protein